MNKLTFVIWGEPVGKGRGKVHAFNVKGRERPIVTVYTPKKTRSYEASVAQSYWTKANDVPPTDGPVGVTIRAYFAMPKSYAKEMRLKVAEESVPQCVKPDSDNIAKSVCDGLKGVAWRDDSQVTTLIVVKRYSDHPRVEVDIDRYVNWREICATIVHNKASLGASKVVNATVIRKVADMSHDIDKRCIKRDVCEKARCLRIENCIHAATKSEVASTLPAPNSASLPCPGELCVHYPDGCSQCCHLERPSFAETRQA